MKLTVKKRAFSLFVLIQVLNLLTTAGIALGCFLIAAQAIFQYEDKNHAVNLMFIWMMVFCFLWMLTILLLSKRLIRKITEPLRSLLEYMELLANGHIDLPAPAFFTPNNEINSLDERLARVVGYMRQRLDDLEQDAETDPLTGLFNRRTLEMAFVKGAAAKDRFAVIMIDIDHFKGVNDTYGHRVGDEVLQFIAQMMRSTSREGDLCCRFGGEEFIILMMKADTKLAGQAAERLRKKIAATPSPTGKPVTISIGITDNSDEAYDAKSLLERADKALYRAKNSGRNRTVAEPALREETEPNQNH